MKQAMRMTRLLLAVLLSIFAFSALAPAAHAQDYNNTPTLGVDKPSVTACQVVVITGSNFPPNSTVTLTVGGAVIGTANSDASGSFSFPWNTCGVAPGVQTVTATSGPTVLSVNVTVLGGTTQTTVVTTTLPYTGSDSTGLARMGAGLVAVGALVVLVARRRMQANATV